MHITDRPALPADEDFLYSLHRAAMRTYVEETWGVWDEAWQRKRFQESFQPEILRVVQVDGQDVGVIQVQERTEELFLVNLEILPAFQDRGIGSALIRRLIEQGKSAGKPVALQVLKVNLSARSLYQRLGFGITGENQTHYIMACEVQPRA